MAKKPAWVTRIRALRLGPAKPAALALVVLVAAAMANAAPAPPAPEPPTIDPERLALAHRLVDEMMPGSTLTDGWTTLVEFTITSGLPVRYGGFLSPTSGAPTSDNEKNLDLAKLQVAVQVGARAITSRATDALAMVDAQDLDSDDLREAITFYASPAGKAVLRRRQAILAATREAQRSSHDPAHRPDTLVSHLSQMHFPVTPEEVAFERTPAGKTMAATGAGSLAEHSVAAISRVWRDAAAVAQSDYCAHAQCAEADRRFFADLAEYFDTPPNPQVSDSRSSAD